MQKRRTGSIETSVALCLGLMFLLSVSRSLIESLEIGGGFRRVSWQKLRPTIFFWAVLAAESR